MLLMFEISQRARNYGEMFLKFSQTSFSGIVLPCWIYLFFFLGGVGGDETVAFFQGNHKLFVSDKE